MRTLRQTDMATLIVGFRNFAKAPKSSEYLFLVSGRSRIQISALRVLYCPLNGCPHLVQTNTGMIV
jgi:hypothetical protein